MSTVPKPGKPKPAAQDNVLTPDDAESFWRALRRWQGELGLLEWRITQSPAPAKGAVMAQMDKWDWKQRQVNCRLGLNWKATPINDRTIEQTAVHELLHVLLYPLIETAKDARHNEDDLASIEHAVINILERIIVPGED